MSEIRFNCFNCGQELVFGHVPGRRDECTRCGADLHSCLNCKNHDSSAYNECREPQAEVVKEKDRANFCGYFQVLGPADRKAGDVKSSQKNVQNDLFAAAEALFKKK